MAEARDIGGISVPFAAGVAAGAAVFPGILGISPFLPSLLALSIIVSTVIAFRSFDGSTPPFARRLTFAGLFLAAGFFCALNTRLASGIPDAAGPVSRLASECARKMRACIDTIPYPDDETGALVKALITGDRSGLDRHVQDIFRASGASHILALSGLHLGIIYLILIRLCTPLGNSPAARKAKFVLIVSLSGFYCLMTGAPPSIVRAFLFITINETAKLSGRKKEPARILLASLTIQLALKPEVISSVGFQLSYLAMAGLTILYPRLERLYPEPERKEWKNVDPVRKVWKLAVMSISCQIFTAPLAWYRFHSFPEYFLLTNLIALPLTSAIVVLSVTTIALSAMGCCPVFLVAISDYAVKLLVSCLETISSM